VEAEKIFFASSSGLRSKEGWGTKWEGQPIILMKDNPILNRFLFEGHPLPSVLCAREKSELFFISFLSKYFLPYQA
jgi:hypothetical protein